MCYCQGEGIHFEEEGKKGNGGDMSVSELLRWCLQTLRKRKVCLISVVGFRSVARTGLGLWLEFRVLGCSSFGLVY